MRGVWASALAIGGILALAAAPPGATKTAHHHAATAAACCRVPAGTTVQVELADDVSTKTVQAGDAFALRLAEPLVVGDQLVIPAGAKGGGVVVQASKPGIGGKPAKLVLAARYLEVGAARVPLQGLQLAAAGRNRTKEASAVGLTGIIFGPLGFVGLAVRGGDVDFPVGTRASAATASTVTLASLGAAPPAVTTAAADTSPTPEGEGDSAAGPHIDIPPPPPGKGEVVFFRRYALLSTGQWFKVRENGVALGKLSNGVYFIQVADPGDHTYTSTFEPELKDHLTLEVAPGQIYFVEGGTSKALVIGAANLAPSDRGAFDRASGKHMKMAAPLTRDDDGDRGDDPPDETPASPPK